MRIRAEREKKEIKEYVQTSHREKVEEFNRFLDELPEHFDIPRVGPG